MFVVLQRLQGELSEAQQLALCLDDRIQENVGNAHILQQCAARYWTVVYAQICARRSFYGQIDSTGSFGLLIDLIGLRLLAEIMLFSKNFYFFGTASQVCMII